MEPGREVGVGLGLAAEGVVAEVGSEPVLEEGAKWAEDEEGTRAAGGK